MSRTTPKPFQQDAIESGVQVFAECKRLLDAAPNDPASCAAALSQHGTLLLEAPTGAGKTLIAGHLVERFATVDPVVWFWFAPFKGVTGQTAASLRIELPGLRLRELSEDRQAADSRAGDVFVTTWQTVATKIKDRRNVHRPGEQNLTLEELLTGLRQKGLRVGVVIDEAHHGFFGAGTETQAMRFFRESLRPEYTLLVTATPDDADIARFQKALGIARLNRITISRQEPVEEGLIKEGIKCVAYVAPGEQKVFVDFEEVALREAVVLHNKIKADINKLGISLTPLMLVQVDSKDKSVERAKERLLKLGFIDSQIATHTAEEPDTGLLALANDESREVLIFKMAVALGFDAPRATTLVSMRAARDEDFGVQLVGRILRVHRRLQARARAKTLPDLLRYGYVLLADAEAQTGLDLAGQKINRLQTEYAKVSPTTAIVHLGGQTHVQVLGPGGQIQLLQPPAQASAGNTASAAPTSTEALSGFTLELLTGGNGQSEPSEPWTCPKAGSQESSGFRTGKKYKYLLRSDVPRRFKTQVLSPNNEVTEEDCARRFIVSSTEILHALTAKVKVQRRTVEVFTHQLEMMLINAAMDPDQAARSALRVLMKNEAFDPRELRKALLRKLKDNLQEIGLEEAEDMGKVSQMLNIILCGHPELLYEAQKAALATHFELEEADEDLPSEVEAETPLATSRLNVYGILPPGLNTWEIEFAQKLDQDGNNVIGWWHRNPPRKPWSIQVVLSDGRGFFPDFVIGVEKRKEWQGVLLADPKYAFELTSELPKTLAVHPAYGKVLILHRQGGAHWVTVRYDEKLRKAVPDREFRLSDATGY